MMTINLMPKKPKKETLETLRIAQRACYKLALFHAERHIGLQNELIEAYEKYFDFLELILASTPQRDDMC